MRIRKKKWIDEELDDSEIYIEAVDLKKKIEEKLKEKNYTRIEMEIGVGKGKFISEIASSNKDILYIGADIAGTMLGIANKSIREKYKEKNEELDNIILVNLNAEYILESFLGLSIDEVYGKANLIKESEEEGENIYNKNLWGEEEVKEYDEDLNKAENEIDQKKIETFNMDVEESIKLDRIYLNFSNPWPKERHKKRRLTHPRQLLQYIKILKESGDIFVKTDDVNFFEDTLMYVLNVNKYSFKYKKYYGKYLEDNKEKFLKEVFEYIEQIKEAKSDEEIENIIYTDIYVSSLTYDLEKEDIFKGRLGNIPGNLETEHEIEFKNEGKKICACIINRRK